MPNLARGSARSENSSGEQFGVASLASRAITPWIRDGSLIAAHNMLWVLWVLWGRPHNTHNTHNMLWAAMREPSRIHGVMARDASEATPNCSPLEFSLRALPRARFGIDRQIFSLLPLS